MIINKEITLQELWLSHAGFRLLYLFYNSPPACYILELYKIKKSIYESPILCMLKQIGRIRKLTLRFALMFSFKFPVACTISYTVKGADSRHHSLPTGNNI